MHGATEPAADASLPPEQFRERAFEVHAAGKAMAMSAIGVADVIVGSERLGDARADRFLPVAEMGGAVNETLKIAALDLLFELADRRHGSIEADPIFVCQRWSDYVAFALPRSDLRRHDSRFSEKFMRRACQTRYFWIVEASSSSPKPGPDGAG